MLKLPHTLPTGFSLKDSEVTWYGKRCVLLGILHAGTSLGALCFVHESVGEEAKRRYDAGQNIATMFEVRVLEQLSEYQCSYMCAGLYQDNKLVGFWDVPHVWLEGRPLLTSANTREPSFVALMAAADTRAAANPVIPVDPFGQIDIDFAAKKVAETLSETAKARPAVIAVKVSDDCDDDGDSDDDDDEITDAEIAEAAKQMGPVASPDEPMEDISNRIELDDGPAVPVIAEVPEDDSPVSIPNQLADLA